MVASIGSRRLPAIAALAIAIVAGALAVGGDDASASRPPAGDYTGLSSQRLAFKLTVAPDGGTVTVETRWRCDGSKGESLFRRHGVLIGDDGSFSIDTPNVVPDTDGDESREHVRVVGRDNGDGTIGGTLNATQEHYNGESYETDGRCGSGDVSYVVRRRDPPAGTDAAGNVVTDFGDTPMEPPSQVAVGAGRTWVVNQYANVVDIDPATGAIAARVVLKRHVFPKLAAGEGAAWVVETGGQPAHLSRIDAHTHRVRSAVVPHTGSRDPGVSALAVGAGGVWVISTCGPRASRHGFLSRIDPHTRRVTRAVALHDVYGALVIAGGSVLASTQQRSPYEKARALAVRRISARTGRASTIARLGGGSVSGLAALGQDVYVTQNSASYSGALRKLDLAHRHLSQVAPFENAVAVAAGDGAVWVLDYFAQTLTRVRP